mgnify:CR=1 FL=1
MTDISVKFPGGGPYMGVDPPVVPAGKVVFPAHLQCVTNTTTVTVTAARYYIVPWFFTGRQTFAGALFKQGGTGDSGKKAKIAFFNASSSGIGTLAKSFGEYTLDASATTKQLASAWTPARGWYWGMFVCDGAGVFTGMTSVRQVSGVGYAVNIPGVSHLGQVIADMALAENVGSLYIGDYVAGTYANFPESTGLAPTNSISGQTGASFPAFAPYT